MCCSEATPGGEQTSEQRGGDVVRGAGDDMERSTGKAEVGGIGLHHDHVASETGPKLRRPARVSLHGDDPCSCVDELDRDRTEAGPDVDD